MAPSRVKQVMEQIETFTPSEKIELLTMLLNKGLLQTGEDYFTVFRNPCQFRFHYLFSSGELVYPI